MSLTIIRLLNWSMVAPGIAVPFIPPIYHRGFLKGISYVKSDNFYTIERSLITLLVLGAPYLLISVLQYSFHSIRWTQYLLLLGIFIAITQLFIYFIFYDTFVYGLFALGFPFVFALPIILVVANGCKRNRED